MSTILIATDVVVRYNERAVINGATLAIEEGARIGLVGRNGAGKTTFLRLLAGTQAPDAGDITRRRDLIISYLPQEFTLDSTRTVYENIRAGAEHVLELIARFEALPAQSKEHEALEHRITSLEGWTLDQRIATAMSHLNCPAAERRIDSLSGGELRRVAIARALVSRPDFLILDEPTNHLDPESIEWVGEFVQEFPGTVLVVTHDRYFLDQVAKSIVELADGRFFSHEGNYTDYLLDKAERQAADAVIEHKRQMFLKRELEWVRTGPRAQRSKQKNRFERYYDTAAQSGPDVEEEIELCIPPPPPLGNRVVELTNLGVEIGGRCLFGRFSFTFENGQRVGVAGRNGLGKTTLLKTIMGEVLPTEGTIKVGQLTRFNYVDQSRLQLAEESTALAEVGEGAESLPFGEGRISVRAYLKRFLFADDRLTTQIKYLSGGERSRLLLARILKKGGNFLILDEPTNDLDLPTLRVLEETLIAFPGVVLVVSHDRYFLNRVCTHVLAFEGDGRIASSTGDYDYYLEKKERAALLAAEQAAVQTPGKVANRPSDVAAKPVKARKLSFKEARELEGMEAQIHAVDEEIARIEALFTSPEFYRTHATQTAELKAQLDTARQRLAALYTRWEELEAIKAQPG
jgi:ABC transport system ATP-binding/permease protein